jgi:hypothetical protein
MDYNSNYGDIIFYPLQYTGMILYSVSYCIICSRCNTQEGLYTRVSETATLRSPWLLISRTLPFGLNVTLTFVFNFTVLLSYRAIRVFLVQKFSCPVATHGHAT